MNALFIVGTLSLGVGLLSLVGLFYLGFKREIQAGSVDVLIWSSVSTVAMIVSDVTLGLNSGFIRGHVLGTVLLAYLTLLAVAALFITISIRRES